MFLFMEWFILEVVDLLNVLCLLVDHLHQALDHGVAEPTKILSKYSSYQYGQVAQFYKCQTCLCL